MSDIAEKLREAYYGDLTDMSVLNDAAEEIERLRAAMKHAVDLIVAQHDQRARLHLEKTLE